MSLGVADLIAGVFKPAADLIDNLHTSEEEKLEQQRKLLEVQSIVMGRAHAYDMQALQSRTDIIVSEAKSDSWLTSNWRPVTMLTFLALIVMRFFGFEAEGMTEAEYIEMWELIKLGLTGYVVTRGMEKGIKEYKKRPRENV